LNKTLTIACITGVAFLLTSYLPAQVTDQLDYFTDDGFFSPVKTMQHPSSEYYNGVTYIAYQGHHEDAYVCAYNHNEEKWYGPYRAGVSLLGDEFPEIDNHGRPTLVVSNDGYIHLFYGGHGGIKEFGENTFGNTHKGKQIHVVSKYPEDITEWEELPNVSPFGTYNQTVKMDNGDIYLFYRHGGHKSHWTYQKSTDNGRTFSDEVIILWHKNRQDDPNIHDAWYAWFDKGFGNTIIVTYNYHLCAEVNHGAYRYNCYYMMMNCSDGTWENAAGQTLSIPITKEYADQNTLVYNSTTTNTRREVCNVDANGNPSVTFRLGSSGYELYFTRWNGTDWETPVRPDGSAENSAGLMFKSPSEIDMLIYGKVNGIRNISWWRSDDSGLSWTKVQTLLSSGTAKHGMSTRTRNAHPDGQFVFYEKDLTDPENLYCKMYLWGKSGFLTRYSETTVGFQVETVKSEFDDKIKIYPNPVKSNKQLFVTIDAPFMGNEINLSVINLLGQKLIEEKIQSNNSVINVKVLPSTSVYILCVTIGNETIIEKLTIE
jgi:hypothetical protein